ncbi:hypothetical protein GCM10009579_66540 [Streptomyces javensis]|uniref:Uncharacterized protein n=1 Tax=Streptomyces javensis TaxID=114698 RepID=A0ABN1XB69_9ACTN
MSSEHACPAGLAATTPARDERALVTWAVITLLTRRLTRRKERAVAPREVRPYYLVPKAV